jgi:hypothetical protein
MTTPTVTELIDFEAEWPTHSSEKTDEIRTRWGLTLPRYYQLRNAAALTEEALAHDPMTTKRIHARLARAAQHRR